MSNFISILIEGDCFMHAEEGFELSIAVVSAAARMLL